jgi:Mrp family chromosome partitioning ATPase
MVERERIIEALRTVDDPELGKSLVDLGMVHDLAIEDGRVHFTLALTTMACPLKDRIVGDARQALLAVEGVDEVAIDLREMTEDEKRRALPQAGRQGQPGQPGGVASHLNRVKRVIAVVSGKGGVGKSSVAGMLAVAWRREGKKVGVLDADITGPSIPMLFGMRGAPPAGPVGILPAESKTGIKIMSINLLLPKEDEAVVWRGPLIGGAIRQFWGDVVWGDLDVLVVDLPPGTADASLTVMQWIPLNGLVLVTSPQDLAGMVVRKAASMANHLNVPILGLVENMSYVICPHCGEQIDVFGPSQAVHSALQIGTPLLGRIPLDPELARRCDAGEIEGYYSEAFEPVAKQVLERAPVRATTPMFG